MLPTDHVLDMFAVPADLEPLAGGQGHTFRAGDLVLSPGHDPEIQSRLSPMLARLAVELDTRPTRHPLDLRIAMPVPARDLSWVVDGWAASRFEPGTRPITDLAATRAAGAVFHAELRRAGLTWTQVGDDRWQVAARIAFGDLPIPDDAPPLVRALAEERDETDIGPNQFVHGDLTGNLLLDANGAPVVIDVAPYWRPALWAEAAWVLDAVMWFDADPSAMDEFAAGAPRQAMVRAALFRLLSDRPPDVGAFERALGLDTARPKLDA